MSSKQRRRRDVSKRSRRVALPEQHTRHYAAPEESCPWPTFVRWAKWVPITSSSGSRRPTLRGRHNRFGQINLVLPGLIVTKPFPPHPLIRGAVVGNRKSRAAAPKVQWGIAVPYLINNIRRSQLSATVKGFASMRKKNPPAFET